MPDRPNILLICTDQQRYDALGCYGNRHIQTPAIDALAAEGVVFEQCYVQNPVCAPSRASMLTGRYVHSHGLYANGVALPPHEQLVTRVLADAGYDCGLIGKLHLAACFGGRTEPRLDDGLRVFDWAHDPYPGSPENQYHRWLEQAYPELYAAALDRRNRQTFDDLPAEAHYSYWVADRAVEFLERGRDGAAPFCLLVNFFDPHHPFGAPAEYLARYDAASLPRPIGQAGELDGKPPIQAEASRESYAGHAPGYAGYTEREIQEIVAAYYAMVTLIDDQTRRILDALERLGLDHNTLVIFTSDHGELLGDHQLLLKGPMFYEGAVRVPLIMRWPGRLPRGQRRAELVQWLDLCATLVDAAGLPRLPRDQGQSLLPLARGEPDAAVRGWAISEYRNSGHPYEPPAHATMLRYDRYKLVVHHAAPASQRARSGELYDLRADPQELRNLWDDPAVRELRMELQQRLLDTLVATEDRTQVREAYW